MFDNNNLKLINDICSKLRKYRNVDLYDISEREQLSLYNITDSIGYLDFRMDRNDCHILFLNYPLYDYHNNTDYLSFCTIDELIKCLNNDVRIFTGWNMYKVLGVPLVNYGDNLTDDEMEFTYNMYLKTGKFYSSYNIKNMYDKITHCIVDEDGKIIIKGNETFIKRYYRSLRIRKV